jgi:hypothetical protein
MAQSRSPFSGYIVPQLQWAAAKLILGSSYNDARAGEKLCFALTVGREHLLFSDQSPSGSEELDLCLELANCWPGCRKPAFMLAATRCRALGVGLLSGGYGPDELRQSGAFRVYEDPADLLRRIDEVGGRR